VGAAKRPVRRHVHKREMAKVSRRASELALFRGVAEHEPGRAELVAELLRHNRGVILSGLPGVERFVDADIRVQLVEARFRRVGPHTTSRLERDVRLQSIALRGESDVAVPIPPRRQLRCELGNDSLVLTPSEGRVVLTLHRELRAPRSLALGECSPCLFEGLFEGLSEPSVAARPPVRTLPRGALDGELPDRLAECVADLLQDHLRLHVLCSAASPDPQPLVLDTLRLYQHRPDDDCFKWRTFLHADVHPSSLACACFLNGKHACAGKVRFSLSFCGRCVEKDTCPTHTQRDNREQAICLSGVTAQLFCVHEDSSPGAKMKIPLSDKPVLPALLAVAAAAAIVAADPEMEDAGCSIAESAVEEAEIGLAESRPPLNERNDKRALHAMRAGMAILKKNGRLAVRTGETPAWLSDLSPSYGYMFPLS
jgi:hypothetical protein